jgi:hypothetical protein
MSSEIANLTNGRAYKIEIYSFSTNENIWFPAFLTNFSDSFKSNWNKVEVYGKMDPIVTFKNTSRSISLGFDIPNESADEAKKYLSYIDTLIRGLYPVYNGGTLGTAIISSPPMFRVRFGNLIKNTTRTDDGTLGSLKTGLLCYMDGFEFKPKIENGFFINGYDIYPKLISVSLTLHIIHEHALGQQPLSGSVVSRENFNSFPHGQSAGNTPTGQGTPSTGATNSQPANSTEQASQGAAEKAINGGG